MKNSLSLIGMPGSGKSTLGVLLAKSLNRQFVDTDIAIQQQTGVTLQDYLDSHGVEALRNIEQEVILSIPLENSVIATGGSAVYGANAMEYLSTHTRVIYLDISLDTMIARLGDFSARGIAKPDDMSLEDMFEERMVLYKKFADLIVSAEQPVEVVRSEIEATF